MAGNMPDGVMNFEKAVDYLKEIEARRGMHLGLENTRKIIEHLRLNLDTAFFIQVAGTNGKGSTSRFLASVLGEAGYKTGLFTSPHLEDIRERITLNNRLIPRASFAECLNRVKETAGELLKRGIIEHMPTYFEYTFLTALCFFSQEQTQAVILEVGLGGRLDATSTITPDVSVITTISRDHTAVLGHKISEIAREKAGIIKPGVPVVCGCKPKGTAYREIKAAADRLQSPFVPVIKARTRLEPLHGTDPSQWSYITAPSSLNCSGEYAFRLDVNGRHQAANAATAIKTLEVLKRVNPGVKVPVPALEKGISHTSIPGRIEILHQEPPVILDAGHNPESAAALADFLKEKQKRNLTLIFGILKDKNFRKMIGMLLPFAGNVILTTPQSERALPPGNMIKYFDSVGVKARVIHQPSEALHAARELKHPILVTGSFYLVGMLRRMLQTGKNQIESNAIPGGNHG